MSKAKQSELREAFNLFDEDGDQMISCSELKALVTKIGGHLSDGEAQALIRAADKDGNNLIDFQGLTLYGTAELYRLDCCDRVLQVVGRTPWRKRKQNQKGV